MMTSSPCFQLAGVATRYFAVDAVPRARPRANGAALDALERRFAGRAPLPGREELPAWTAEVACLAVPLAVVEGRRAAAWEASPAPWRWGA